MTEPQPSLADAKAAQIARINELSQLARTAWFTLTGYLVFVGITLLGVQDADFFLSSRQTQLPLVGVQIPTASFFWTAPVLGAALYAYLHLFLIKLWDAHVPPTRDADPTHHWLVNDFVLLAQSDPTARARPLARLGAAVTVLLVWIAGPFVLGYAWLRSMPAHDEWLTLTIALCLFVTLWVGTTSAWTATARLHPQWCQWGRRWQKRMGLGLGVLLLSTISWLRTEGGFEEYDARYPLPKLEAGHPFVALGDQVRVGWTRLEALLPLARIDLAGDALGAPPADWRDHDYARRRYREEWCERRDIDLATCDSFGIEDPDAAGMLRAAWCADHPRGSAACTDRFDALAGSFAEEWAQERESYLSQVLVGLDQTARDLRRADLNGAFLADADLSLARLEGADLSGARLEGAVLRLARLEGADLSGARLEGADLSQAGLEGANLFQARLEGAELSEAGLEGAALWQARLEGADLSGARLEGADLSGARLEGADLRLARLQGADLSGARLEGAVLWRARLEGADLGLADFRDSNWAGALNRASPAQFADFRGAQGLTQAQLEHFIGNEGTLLPEGDAPDTGQPWYVWNCWEAPPPNFDQIVAAGSFADDSYRAALRADFLCGRHPRIKFSTRLADDAAYPPGHPLGDSD